MTASLRAAPRRPGRLRSPEGAGISGLASHRGSIMATSFTAGAPGASARCAVSAASPHDGRAPPTARYRRGRVRRVPRPGRPRRRAALRLPGRPDLRRRGGRAVASADRAPRRRRGLGRRGGHDRLRLPAHLAGGDPPGAGRASRVPRRVPPPLRPGRPLSRAAHAVRRGGDRRRGRDRLDQACLAISSENSRVGLPVTDTNGGRLGADIPKSAQENW